MYRTFLTVFAIVATGVSMAEEGAKKPVSKPIGTWTRVVEGGSWELSIQESRILFKAIGPGERTMTLTAPRYEISDEGILFGYVREMSQTDGADESDTAYAKVVHPFAFRLKVAGETITISDLAMRSVDARAHVALTGEFKKELDRNAAKPSGDAKELKR